VSRTGVTDEPPGGSAPHVVVADLDSLDADADTWHHLLRVRRARVGSALTVTDGLGRWRPCRISSLSELEADGDIVSVARPDPEITVAFALTKGDRPELVIQKLTELGVDRIVPFRAARSVVRWDETKAATARRRWTAVARSAVEQAKRCWLPHVEAVTDVTDLAGRAAVRVDRGGGVPSLARSVVAVGPEGGWDDEERIVLPEAVALGPHVLRAETAALTAGVLLCSLRSGLVAGAGTNATGSRKAR